jgi:hypothetical protein
MNRTLRTILIVAGVACFAVAAVAAAGWISGPNVTALALAGLACWLASTLP